MDRCDVLIVGGGPSGSSCAWGLRGSGLDVMVMDKRTFPRDKVCAGWVTPPVFTALDLDPADYAQGRVLQPITNFQVGMLGGREVDVAFDEPQSYGIRRCEFDHYLLQRCGARLRLGEAVKSLRPVDDGWIVNDQLQARFLVGAGGHFCPVARQLGARIDRGSQTVAAQEVEFEVPLADLDRGSVLPYRPELYFCPDLKGYGWCFRKGAFLNVGIGRLDKGDLPSHTAELVTMLREQGKVAAEIPERFHGHAYQLYERKPPELIGDRVLLIGDAAGLAYPQSGEGIRPAVESALMAAGVIEGAALETYRQRVFQRFGQPRQGATAEWLPASWLQSIAGRLIASPWFARHVVLERWFLHTQQPALDAARRVTGPGSQ